MHKQDFKRWVTTALWDAHGPIHQSEASVYYKAMNQGDSSLEAFVRIIHSRAKDA